MYKTDDEIYGKRFYVFRFISKKTQKEVCNYLGVTQSALSKYESGKLQPPLDILVKMKELYKVPLDVLLGTVTNEEMINYMKNNKDFEVALKTLDEMEKNNCDIKDIETLLKNYHPKKK